MNRSIDALKINYYKDPLTLTTKQSNYTIYEDDIGLININTNKPEKAILSINSSTIKLDKYGKLKFKKNIDVYQTH